MRELIEAVGICHRLKDKPMSQRYYDQNAFLNYATEIGCLQYFNARDVIHRWPRIEKILLWINWI